MYNRSRNHHIDKPCFWERLCQQCLLLGHRYELYELGFRIYRKEYPNRGESQNQSGLLQEIFGIRGRMD